MIWFKFFTGTFQTPGISKLFEYGGWAYYARWVHLKSIIAAQMNYETDACQAEHPPKKWGTLLGLKQKKLKTFFKLLEEVLETKVEYSENIIKISIPKLLKERDYRKKASGIRSHGKPKTSPLEGEGEGEEDLKEKNIKKESVEPLEDKPIPDLDFIKSVLENLNAVSGKKYTHKNAANCEHIRARKNEGATLDNFYEVNRKQALRWLGGDMEKYLRPSTLYLPSKFEGYLNAPEKQGNPALRDYPESNPNDSAMLKTIKSRIAKQVLPESFATWFAPLSDTPAGDRNGQAFELLVPNEFFKKYLTENYLELIENSVETVTGIKKKVILTSLEHLPVKPPVQAAKETGTIQARCGASGRK